ncbi:hypothetical protein ACFQV2_19800 [Actinokineospora soli]|uniref:Uncharacterized protein n=1 Tax=Actinokineospora soli TaxID=1048753 RepID=A0ABW2TNP0_9PSEU
MTGALRTRRGKEGLGGALAGLMAVWAFAGVIGVYGGGVDFGPVVTARLPWESPVLAGTALLLAVAVPMSVAAGLVWRRSRSGPVALLAAGLLLVAWILVQILFIRTFSWLQPVCFGYGFVVAWLGAASRGWS